MSEFRYSPQISDVLRSFPTLRRLPGVQAIVDLLARRDRDLEDYLSALTLTGPGLLARTYYRPAADTTYTVNGAALDTTNLTVTFTGPDSGRVLVVLTAKVVSINTTRARWGLLNNSGSAVVSYQEVIAGTAPKTGSFCFYTTATAGVEHTWNWAQTSDCRTSMGPTHGPGVMEVWACP